MCGRPVTRTRISSGTASDYLTTYTWDYRDRLTDVDYYNNSSVLTKHIHYVYDAWDSLIGTEIDATGSGSYGSSEWYALDLAETSDGRAVPVLQFDGSGNETHRFLDGPSASGLNAVMGQEQITTQGSAGTTTYVLADNLGSVRDVVNASSTVVDHIVYNSFGQVAYESNTSIAHWAAFAGYHIDVNTGLDYADHRWYDPVVGRWISEDPLGFGGGDTNVSRYAGNGATNHVDPQGLDILGQSNYWYYLTHPGEMDASLQSAQQVALTATVIAGAMAAGLVVAPWAVATAGASGWQAVALGGAVDGITQYGVSGIGMHVITGGQAPLPTAGGAVVAGATGAAVGLVTHGAGLLLGAPNCPGGGPTCFVAGTQVVVPGQGTTMTARMTTVDISLAAAANVDASARWLVSIALAGLGVAGYRASGARKRRQEDEAVMRAANERLFRDLERDDMLKEGTGDRLQGTAAEGDYMIPDETIDELCEALFHANVGQVSNLPYPKESPAQSSAAPSNAMPLAPSADALATLPRPVGRQYATVCRRQAAPLRAAPRRHNHLGLIWLAACLLLGGWLGFGGLPNSPTQRSESTQFEEPPVVADVAGTQAPRTVNIEDIRVGQRVVGTNPDRASDGATTDTQVDPRTWRLVRLHAEARWKDGTLDTIEVETLQPRDWVRRFAPRVGVSAPIPLDLVDMGLPAELCATVVTVEPCPEIEPAPGNVVLTTVNHLNSFLLELSFADSEGGVQTVKPTGFHKFYSQTRRDWVSASELRKGETLNGLHDSLSVVAVERIPGVHRVYNMTVEGEHVYHVSPLGVLVHNNACQAALMPGGNPIGTPGSPGVQVVPGGMTEAQDLFNQAAQGGTPILKPGYPGTAVEPQGGGFLGLRPASTSGGPAIDVNAPGIPFDKIHFK